MSTVAVPLNTYPPWISLKYVSDIYSRSGGLAEAYFQETENSLFSTEERISCLLQCLQPLKNAENMNSMSQNPGSAMYQL